MVAFFSPPPFMAGLAPLAIGTQTTDWDEVDRSTYTFASLGNNVAANEQLLIITMGRAAANSRNTTGVTVNGVTALRISTDADLDTSANGTWLDFWLVPTKGVGGNVVVTCAGTLVRMFAAAFPLKNLKAAAAISETSTSAGVISSDIPKDGGAFIAAWELTASALTGCSAAFTITNGSGNNGTFGFYQGAPETARALTSSASAAKRAIALR